MIKNFVSPKRHPNPIIGSKVTAIFMKGWILPIGEVALGKGLGLQPAQQAFLHSFVLCSALQYEYLGISFR